MVLKNSSNRILCFQKETRKKSGKVNTLSAMPKRKLLNFNLAGG
jgi:hypothetical protein